MLEVMGATKNVWMMHDDIKAKVETWNIDVSSQSNPLPRFTGSWYQERIINRITDYVQLEATCDPSAKLVAP